MLKGLKINVRGCVNSWAKFYFMIVSAGAHIIPHVLVTGPGNLSNQHIVRLKGEWE